MPPKQSITQQIIIDAAFRMIREDGKKKLTARNIAKMLSCSTQPIYSCFSNMEDLENAVIKMALDYIAETYLTGSRYADTPFFSMGLGYIQMARKDPNLFDLIYQSGYTVDLFGEDLYPKYKDRLLDAMKTDAILKRLDRDTLADILSHMWIYTHGLAMLARNNPELSSTRIREKLHEMGRILIETRLNEKGINSHEFYSD